MWHQVIQFFLLGQIFVMLSSCDRGVQVSLRASALIPKTISVTPGDRSCIVRWTREENTLYTVKRSSVQGQAAQGGTVAGPGGACSEVLGSSCGDSNLVNGEVYYYSIQGKNKFGVSDWSPEISCDTRLMILSPGADAQRVATYQVLSGACIGGETVTIHYGSDTSGADPGASSASQICSPQNTFHFGVNLRGTAGSKTVSVTMGSLTRVRSLLFNPGGINRFSGFNSAVRGIKVDPVTGKIYVYGNFSFYGADRVSRLVRLNSDGSLDQSFNASSVTHIGGTGTVSMALDSLGRVILAGSFGLRRHNLDGSLDASFSVTISQVTDVAVTNDDKIMAVGDFTTVNFMARGRIVRLNADGSVDMTFATPFSGFNARPNALAIDQNGRILVGGDFTTYASITHNRIVRLQEDGQVDTTFDNATGFDARVTDLTIDAVGSIYVGGDFTAYKGVSNLRLIKLVPDGAPDTSFISGTGFNGSVTSVFALASGDVFVRGDFTAFKESPLPGVAKVSATGTLDFTFPYLGLGSDVLAIDQSQLGPRPVFLGGRFTNFFLSLGETGSPDSRFAYHQRFNGTVTDQSTDALNRTVVVGDFSSYMGHSAPRIARLNSDGTLDTTFTPGTGFDGLVRGVAHDELGRIIVFGDFVNYQSLASPKLIRLQSNGDPAQLNPVPYLSSEQLLDVKLAEDGKLLVLRHVVGDLESTSFLNRHNADLTLDLSFNQITFDDTSSSSAKVSMDAQGRIYVLQSGFLERYTSFGSLDTAFNCARSSIFDFTILPDGFLLVGGSFAERFARINTDGSLDNSFLLPGLGIQSPVQRFVVDAQGRFVLYGPTTFDGVSVPNLLRLLPDGSLDRSFHAGVGVTGSVEKLVLSPSHEIVLLGRRDASYNNSVISGRLTLQQDGSLSF